MDNNVYKIIGGYCEGYFDNYDDKIIILEGESWIVCKYLERNEVDCVNFKDSREKNDFIKDWERMV